MQMMEKGSWQGNGKRFLLFPTAGSPSRPSPKKGGLAISRGSFFVFKFPGGEAVERWERSSRLKYFFICFSRAVGGECGEGTRHGWYLLRETMGGGLRIIPNPSSLHTITCSLPYLHHARHRSLHMPTRSPAASLNSITGITDQGQRCFTHDRHCLRLTPQPMNMQ